MTDLLIIFSDRLPAAETVQYEAESEKRTECLKNGLNEVRDHYAEEAGYRRIEQNDNSGGQHALKMRPTQYRCE